MKILWLICFFACLFLAIGCFAKLHQRLAVFDAYGARDHALVETGFLLFAGLTGYLFLMRAGVL